MARKKTSRLNTKATEKTMENDSLQLEYDLYKLPTAQHRAGLAGLVLQIGAMDREKGSKNRNNRFSFSDDIQ